MTAPRSGRRVPPSIPWDPTKSHVFPNQAELFMRAEPACGVLSLAPSGGHEWDPIRGCGPVKTLLHVFLGQESGTTRRNANAQVSYAKLDTTVNKHRRHCNAQFLNSAGGNSVIIHR